MKTCPNGCFEKITEKIKENVPDAVKIKIPSVMSFSTAKREPIFPFSYKRKIRSRITVKTYDFNIVMSYCPHCGHKLEEV